MLATMVAVGGLLLPGYFLARGFRLSNAEMVAFPLSALMLVLVVIGFVLFEIPLRFESVLGVLAGLTAMAFGVALMRSGWAGGGKETTPEKSEADDWAVRRLALMVGGLVLAGIAFRSFLFPLSGPDTLFRWEGLARGMLEHQGLHFYPPIGAEDFRIYLFPDAIPPLVASLYWWLYAAWGEAYPALTSVPVVLQVICCSLLTQDAARRLYGPTGGWLAAGTLAATPLFLQGVAMGQETGFTALSVAGQLAFSLAAIHSPNAANVVVVGLFAAIGALARDYGPALAAVGLFVLANSRETRRFLPLFILTCLACAAPWYARTWWRTGNPLYPRDLGLGLPANPVESGLVAGYKSIFGLHRFTVSKWWLTLGLIASGAPLAILLGTFGLFASRRTVIAWVLGLAGLWCTALWLASVGFTTGGVGYTLRVLTPVWVILAVGAGALGPRLAETSSLARRAVRWGVLLALATGGGYSVLTCLAYPAPVHQIGEAILSRRADPLDRYEHYLRLVRMINTSGLPVSGILSDNYYFATVLQRRSRHQPVMAWSPEVSFLFDHRHDAAEVRRRLLARKIHMASVQVKSSNNNYLMLHRFYNDDLKQWLVGWSLPGLDVVLLIPLGDDVAQASNAPSARRDVEPDHLGWE